MVRSLADRTFQLRQEAGVDGAVIVTTPQEVALQDVRKEVNFCKKVNLPILGVVENMAGFCCPHCRGKVDIFNPSTGGAKALCDQFAGLQISGLKFQSLN